jgi:hypothetical protein
MATKLVIAFFLTFVAGVVGCLAFIFVVPYPGVAIWTGGGGIWIGAWWLLGVIFIPIAASIGWTVWVLTEVMEKLADIRSAPVPKEDLSPASSRLLAQHFDLRADHRAAQHRDLSER